MEKQKWGHIINMSPPIDLDILPGKIAYCISKFGMTMIAHGLAKEYEGKGIAVNALWPITMFVRCTNKYINTKLGLNHLLLLILNWEINHYGERQEFYQIVYFPFALRIQIHHHVLMVKHSLMRYKY